MGLFRKIGCAVGLHKGEFRYVRQGSCDMVQVCEACKHETHKVIHTYEWRFVKPDKCDQVSECTRCGDQQEETRVSHTYGDWRFVAPDKCNQVRECKRCGAQETRIQHNYGRPAYKSSGDCATFVTCARCGHEKSDEVRHQFGEWHVKPGTRADERVCSRCYATEIRPTTSPSPAPPVAQSSRPAAGFDGFSHREVIACPECHGSGTHSEPEPCYNCLGSGTDRNAVCRACNGKGSLGTHQVRCRRCDGHGIVYR